jgi:dihydroneopterin aldolase
MLDQLTLNQLRVQGALDTGGPDRLAKSPGQVAAPTPTPLEVDLDLHLDLEEAGRADDLAHSVDLSLVAQVIETIAASGHWSTLESLGLCIVRTLLLAPAPGEARARVEAVTLRVRRPAWLRSHATPGIVLHRTRSWCTTERRVLGPGVAADVVAETRCTEIWRVRLTPGARWQVPERAEIITLVSATTDGRTVTSPNHPGAILMVKRK